MTRPIADPAHASARTRRRQRSSLSLLRIALVIALIAACAFAVPAVVGAVRGAGPRGPGPGNVQGQVAIAGLESGACMSFSPTSGDASKTIFVDAGHGGLDPGVVGEVGGQTVQEKDAALAVATRLAGMLEADGYRVVLSRTKDSSVMKLTPSDSVTGALKATALERDLVTRAACANASGASALLSIHFNAFGDPSVGGTETFYDGARSFASESKRLATDVQGALVAALSTSDRGVWTDDQLTGPALTAAGAAYGHLIELGPAQPGYVDSPSQMPGALVEPLFLTNDTEARVADSASGQNRIATALKDGLEKYLAGS
ncbi:MAG TPA: N-acetylmuramoyl-L-alanine amidase [Candidatus Dormibacteraeota bacterium]|nr:N-acetylmuramoyl-L-alanine amidase [Candidatus Dormibacteraeota bacterium]